MLQLIVSLTFSSSITGPELDNTIEQLVSESRQDDGCIRYEAYKNSENSHSILFLEHWQSEQSLKAHKNAGSVQNFKAAAGQFITGSTVLSSSAVD